MDEFGTGYQRKRRINILKPHQVQNPLSSPLLQPLKSTPLTPPPLLRPQNLPSKSPTPTTDAGSHYHTSSAAYPSSPSPAATLSDPVRVPLVRWLLLILLWPFFRTCRPSMKHLVRCFAGKRSGGGKWTGDLRGLGGEAEGLACWGMLYSR